MSRNASHEKTRYEKFGGEEMPVSESFVVDIEGFSHLTESEINGNSRIYSINHSRKGLMRGGGEKKITSTAANQSTAAALEASTAAILHGVSTPEKPIATAATEHAGSPKNHHQISIKKGSLSSPPPESRHVGKRFGHRHSPTAWSIDPRKLLMFFATLSSFGTILLIYFTLSMGELNGDDDGLNTLSFTSPAAI